MNRISTFMIAATVACLATVTAADAKKKLGHTSGHASGTHVEPSTATQKRNPHLKDADNASSLAAGAPGVEGSRGTQSGRHPRPRSQ